MAGAHFHFAFWPTFGNIKIFSERHAQQQQQQKSK